jgi:hypothetical protein
MGIGEHNLTDFDFDFEGQDRRAFLHKAQEAAAAADLELAGEPGGGEGAISPTLRLLHELDQEIAQFGSDPEVLELKREHFTLHGLTVPTQFEYLSRTHRFFWVRYPITLKPADDKPFVKLKCAVEFNADVAGSGRPVARMILPDRKIVDLAKGHMSLDIQIGEDFEFHGVAAPLTGLIREVPPSGSPVVKPAGKPAPVTSGSLAPSGPASPADPASSGSPAPGSTASGALGGSSASGQAKVDVKAAAKAGIVAGPFQYRVTKAQVTHSPAMTEKVFWTLADAHSLEEEDPSLVTILQIPNGVSQVTISAALQAYHGFNFLAADVSRVLPLLTERFREFFRTGAPASDQHVWDISPQVLRP